MLQKLVPYELFYNCFANYSYVNNFFGRKDAPAYSLQSYYKQNIFCFIVFIFLQLQSLQYFGKFLPKN